MREFYMRAGERERGFARGSMFEVLDFGRATQLVRHEGAKRDVTGADRCVKCI